MNRIYKSRSFARFASKERISDIEIRDAIRSVEEGLLDADLGGGLLKLRLARSGQGKRGAYRAIVAFRTESFAVFLYGFAKKDRENLDATELRALRVLAKAWLQASPETFAKAKTEGMLIEVKE